MEWSLKANDYHPRYVNESDSQTFGIALIGCGGIAVNRHLPMYKQAGYRVVACCDIREEAARGAADKFDIPFWTTNVDDIVERDDVHIIDLALHPQHRMEVLERIARKPRAVLSQKPLHFDLQEAKRMATFAEASGIVMGVNQQARWAPAHRAIRVLLDRGAVGAVYSMHNVKRTFQDQPNTWMTAMEHFNIVDNGIHYMDLCRYFAASPAAGRKEWTRVHCTTAYMPGQNAVSPMVYSLNVEFGDKGGREPLMASLQFNNIVRAPKALNYEWRIDGTEGSLWANHNTLWLARADERNTFHEQPIEGNWMPDAFQGPMGDMMNALAQGRPPAVTPQDNLITVAMTNAAVLSSMEGRVVERAEVLP
ncbi:Gfo/Idh/MocA family protein [Paenibacillus koleovorans]|uniref:Gfo/Idh/MocA family protein n=1 Tax=Paenibacillus koleovorans TaxID=121608 RepID=UPI000FDB5BC4|nr:Gfo/Idh/MocA family oxidoreductase [Paenibacillus koleovorans]